MYARSMWDVNGKVGVARRVAPGCECACMNMQLCICICLDLRLQAPSKNAGLLYLPATLRRLCSLIWLPLQFLVHDSDKVSAWSSSCHLAAPSAAPLC